MAHYYVPMDEHTYYRRLRIVDKLSALPDDDPEDQPEILNDRVRDVLLGERATMADFRFLDEKPGAAPGGGYRWGQGEWHWKLRRVRNRAGKALFGALAQD